MAWEVVCSPKWADGLGIPNLKWLNVAMQARWPWLKRTDPSRPWAEFDIVVPEESTQLYRATTWTTVGNGNKALFWEDRWLQGRRVEEVAPNIYTRVRQPIRATCTIHQGLSNGTWALDIGPKVTEQMLLEYFWLWDLLTVIRLEPDIEDSYRWAWDKSGR